MLHYATGTQLNTMERPFLIEITFRSNQKNRQCGTNPNPNILDVADVHDHWFSAQLLTKLLLSYTLSVLACSSPDRAAVLS